MEAQPNYGHDEVELDIPEIDPTEQMVDDACEAVATDLADAGVM